MNQCYLTPVCLQRWRRGPSTVPVQHSQPLTLSFNHAKTLPCNETNDIFHNNEINNESHLNGKIIANGNMYAHLGCTLVQPG